MTSEELHQSRRCTLREEPLSVIFGDVSAGAGGPIDSDLAAATLSCLRQETTVGLGTIGSLWLTADPTAMDILRLPPSTQRRLNQHIIDAEHDADEVLQINKSVLNDLAIALNKTMLVEGSALQAFPDRVIPWPPEEAKLSKIEVPSTSDRDRPAPLGVGPTEET